MNRLVIGSLLFLCLNCPAEDPFPAFQSLSETVKMPRDAKLAVAPEGHFTVNGEARYLPGTIYYEATPGTIRRHTAGYPTDLNWLYQDVPGYEGFQRIGFDAVGVFTPNDWLNPYRGQTGGDFADVGGELYTRILRCGLPLYVDYTCAPWHHGGLRAEQAPEISPDAFTVPGPDNVHWMPYSATTPAGRQLYIEMWKRGAEFIRDQGGKPFVYELFNEPDYNDWSDYNRKRFAERMKEKFGTIDELNRRWKTSHADFDEVGRFKRTTESAGLTVEWIKFMNDCFTEICKIGIETIRATDPRPEILFCFQPLAFRGSCINLYETARWMNLLCSSTGGGNALQARFLRSIGKGKPILDGETYVGKSRKSFRNHLWLQYARGFNASFLFKWDRRTYDREWKNADESGGKIVAETFPYLLLNPYAVPTEAILGVMDAKREILLVNDLFTPRDRGVKSEIALLYSLPSERLARATGETAYNLLEEYALALEYAPMPFDVVLEEDPAKFECYPVIVAAGVNAVYDRTPKALEQFVRRGGTLILGQEPLQADEYGNAESRFGIRIGRELSGEPGTLKLNGRSFQAALWKDATLDPDFRTLASLDGRPVISEKRIGKGKVIFVNARMPLESLAPLLTELAAPGKPLAELTDHQRNVPAYRIEVNKAVRNGEVGYILINQSPGSRLIRFRPGEEMTFSLPFAGKLLQPRNGEYLLLLPPAEAVVLVGSTPERLAARFGQLPIQEFQEAERAGREILRREKSLEKAEKKAFHIDANRLKFIDLRRHANRDFVDRVAGDGRGGWTDQGENSLHHVPWGVAECNGVLFDFIRTDQNEGRTCIVLGSRKMADLPGEVRDIRVDSRAKRLYFLHASAWSGNQESFRYLIRYSDGTRREVPIRDGIEIADWYRMTAHHPGRIAVPGWMNSEKRGLWIYCWENPHPEKEIASLDLKSAGNDSIGIVAAITLETPGGESGEFPLVKFPPDNFHPANWGDCSSSFQNDRIILRVNEKSKNWCGTALQMKSPVKIPAGYEKGSLSFEINGGADAWGKHSGGQELQVKLMVADQNGNVLKTPYVKLDLLIDADGETFQTVRLPLRRLLSPAAAEIRNINFQFRILPPERSGVEIRNVQLTLP